MNDQQLSFMDIQEVKKDESSQMPTLPSLTPKDDKFKVEINLGLALPFKSYNTSHGGEHLPQRSVVKSVAPDGSIYRIEVETHSDQGPLGGLDNDVLTVLLTMAWEQKDNKSNKSDENGFRVYYTLTEICRRLGLSENSRSKIKKSIETIKGQNLKVKNFIYNGPENKVLKKDEETRIILKSGKIKAGRVEGENSEFIQTSYVEFDKYIINNLHNEYFSVINQKDYLALSSGPERRVIIFLQSKRKKFGDSFAFELSELAQILGLADSQKKSDQIKKFLKRVKDKIGIMDFSISKVWGQQEWNIVVEFSPIKELSSSSSLDPFYSALVKYYGKDKLDGLEVNETDVINWREEFNSRFKAEAEKDFFRFGKEDVDPAEFCIDVTLYQVIKKNYLIRTSVKAVAKTILRGMVDGLAETPEGYRFFIYKRIEKEEKSKALEKLNHQTEIKKKNEEAQKQMMDQAFNKMYNDLFAKSPRLIKELEKQAKSLIDIPEDDMVYKLTLQHKMREIAREDFESGKLMDFVGE